MSDGINIHTPYGKVEGGRFHVTGTLHPDPHYFERKTFSFYTCKHRRPRASCVDHNCRADAKQARFHRGHRWPSEARAEERRRRAMQAEHTRFDQRIAIAEGRFF